MLLPLLSFTTASSTWKAHARSDTQVRTAGVPKRPPPIRGDCGTPRLFPFVWVPSRSRHTFDHQIHLRPPLGSKGLETGARGNRSGFCLRDSNGHPVSVLSSIRRTLCFPKSQPISSPFPANVLKSRPHRFLTSAALRLAPSWKQAPCCWDLTSQWVDRTGGSELHLTLCSTDLLRSWAVKFWFRLFFFSP